MKYSKFLIILLCLLLLTGCAPSSAASLDITETPCDALVVLQHWNWMTSFDEEPRGLGIQTSLPDATFILTADDGSILKEGSNDYARSVTLSSGERCGWTCFHPGEDSTNPNLWEGTVTYIDVLIQKDSTTIGYAVLKVQGNDHLTFSAEVLKCVTFAGQQVTDAWLQKALAEAKK